MPPGTPRIAVRQGASSANIRRCLAAVASGLAADGVRLAESIETAGGAGSGGGSPMLRDPTTGAEYPITRDLGAGSTACAMDPAGLAAAGFAVRRTIADGADLVLLGKFGTLEAAGGCLRDAFAATAIAAIPVPSSVAPALSEPRTAFAGPVPARLALPADHDAVPEWWACLAAPS